MKNLKFLLRIIFNIYNLKRAFHYIIQGNIHILIHKALTWIFHSPKEKCSNLTQWIQNNTQDKILYDKRIFKNQVDIVIPVFNGYDYLGKLFNTLPKTDIPFRIFIVNDKSSDERIAPFLEETIKKFNDSILISNEENMGFIESVNKALSMTENHIVIVNTDVELPEKWLERLISPFYVDPLIASATPFTNSGTICSFPIINEDNDLLPGLTLNEVDAAFQLIKPIH